MNLALWNKRPTEVAREAGVHPGTLSRIINGHQKASDQLIQKIEQAIRKSDD